MLSRTPEPAAGQESPSGAIRTVLAQHAVAATLVPATLAGLYAQRLRWTAGHLQCCGVHAMLAPQTVWRFRWLVFPNFVASTLFAPAGLAALIALMANGRSELLAMDWQTATLISMVLAYTQRGVVRVLERNRRMAWRVFLLEPLVTNLVNLLPG